MNSNEELKQRSPKPFLALGATSLLLAGCSIAYEINSENNYGLTLGVIAGIVGYGFIKHGIKQALVNTAIDEENRQAEEYFQSLNNRRGDNRQI